MPQQFAELYARMSKIYFDRAEKSDSGSKMQQLRARALFCDSAGDSLRTSNSSSLLERSFSDALRSVADKRVKLRNVLENIIISSKYN